MSAYYEIARTDAEEPWQLRFYSGRHIVVHGSNYARKVGAERAICAIARAHGYEEPEVFTARPADIDPYEEPVTFVAPRNATGLRPNIEVRYTDERGQ